jgi:hypothetical protein
MSMRDPAGTDWSGREIDLIIADYFDMLRLELAGESYVKAQHNEALQRMTGRSRGSIEYKHQNISAVLAKLCLPWIPGYKPMPNFQKALLDGIERYLDAGPGILISPQQSTVGQLAEPAPLYLEPAPMMATAPEADSGPLQRLVRKFDPAARDERNRSLGKSGEERVLISERIRLEREGRSELARRVRWIAQEEGDGAGYDIRSFEADGRERLLEVKTTTGHQLTPFFLTENERGLSEERPDAFRIVRLYDFMRQPRAFELVPPLERCVLLRPASYKASFGNPSTP